MYKRYSKGGKYNSLNIKIHSLHRKSVTFLYSLKQSSYYSTSLTFKREWNMLHIRNICQCCWKGQSQKMIAIVESVIRIIKGRINWTLMLQLKQNLQKTLSILWWYSLFKQNKRLIYREVLLIYHSLQGSIPGLNTIGLSVLCVTVWTAC